MLIRSIIIVAIIGNIIITLSLCKAAGKADKHSEGIESKSVKHK